MQTFARLLSFVSFLLSVGLLAQALPTAVAGNGLAVRDYSTPAGYNGGSGYAPSPSYAKESYAPASKEDDPTPSIDLLALVTKLHDDVEPICKELEVAATVEVAIGIADKIVALVKALIAVCVNVKLNLSVDVKTEIALKIVAIICLIVKALAAVCVKLGVDVCIALIAKIDVCLHLLLITLNVCVDGLLAIVISLCAKLDVSALAALKLLNLKLVIKICALVKIVANVAI
ncbi:hypothetical protein ACGC1H_001039 [Rhizoctonia solani]|uniref:Transmembrane protein n=1 Tax=Rhizoctonia solani TaxID=456999 RepID=A0A8H3BFI4_9AGAM|nr:unnamed protein product [Rhizoctonia solani]